MGCNIKTEVKAMVMTENLSVNIIHMYGNGNKIR